jgi:hypothetical protein
MAHQQPSDYRNIRSARTDVKDKDGRLPRDLARDRDIKDLLPKPEGGTLNRTHRPSLLHQVIPLTPKPTPRGRQSSIIKQTDNEDAWDLGDSDSD